jgi:hypothetical protein
MIEPIDSLEIAVIVDNVTDAEDVFVAPLTACLA